jgi:D-psicose/D-tagatose/L-ribulose 3-epimerase
MSFKYSITLSSFIHIEPVEVTLTNLVESGFTAVEMMGEPKKLNQAKLRDLLSSFGVNVCGVTGMWGSMDNSEEGGGRKRNLLSSDISVIRHTQSYVQSCIELCRLLGGTQFNICLFADDDLIRIDKNHKTLSFFQKQKVVKRAIPMLTKLSHFARDRGVVLVIEPLNRYSTPYCSSAKEALDVASWINEENVGVMLDTFHMNIEEDSFENAILQSKSLLYHMHFADNNRKMPGNAHIDFDLIVKSLNKIGYGRYISFEPNISEKNYADTIKNGLNYIHDIEKKQMS